MRKLLTLLFALANIISFAANLNEEIRDGYTLANDNYSGVCAPVPEMREIYGGTVFRVFFDEDCPVELQGAFNYACRIWEENVLTCLPINISVSVDKIRTFGSNKVLSNVRYRILNFDSEWDNMFAIPSTNVKYTVLKENHFNNNIHYVSEIDSAGFFDLIDIQIVYNEDCLNEFSYNIASEPEYGYYDFVTLALRDIAKGLGLEHSFLADTSAEEILFPNKHLTPFETIIQNAMGTSDPHVAYQNCTNGTFAIDIAGYSWENDYGEVTLYAPNPWIDNASLQYFIPDEEKPFTQLLTYDFCKGYVMRNISDEYDKLLPQALNWTYDVVSGGSSASINENGHSTNVLPFKGSFSIPNYSKSMNERSDISPKSIIQTKNVSSTTTEWEYFDVNEYCKPYLCYSDAARLSGKYFSISVLKKDGTWDIVYDKYDHYNGETINLDNMPLHYNIEDYARTCDGRLRYRFANSTYQYSHIGESRSCGVKYYAREYTPQKAFIKYSGLYEPSTSTRSASSDDYWVDIKVGIKNLEGTTRVVVEQLDDGELLPFSYDVDDFKRGYFVATVDKDFPTQFTVISYNENGTTRSNTITVPPVSETIDQGNIDIKIGKHQIIIDTDKLDWEKISYRIDHLSPVQTVIPIKRLANDGIIDISQLQKGAYALTLFEDGEYKTSEKFMH